MILNHAIDSIRQKYSSAYDCIFLAAVQLVYQYGAELCMNDEWIEDQEEAIRKMHDDGNHHPVTAEAEIGVLRCAHEIASVPLMNLMAYMQEYMPGTLASKSYADMRHNLFRCMEYIDDDSEDSFSAYIKLHDIGISDHCMNQMGFGYLVDAYKEACEDDQ